MTDDLDIDAIEAAPWYYAEGHEGRVVELCQEVRRLRAEVAARPEITPEDAAHVWSVSPRTFRTDGLGAASRVWEALREHAKGAKS